jgi:phage host-nuclease inhibitor protein Gam
MAKPASKEKPAAGAGPAITTREEADQALANIGGAIATIEKAEAAATDQITKVREEMVRKTAEPRALVDLREKALEAWAKTDRKTWPDKHLELNFGTVGFRLGKAAIKFKLEIAAIVERLRAKKLLTCIRVTEEPDKEKLAAYDDETLEAVGCAKTKPKDKFYYDVKREGTARDVAPAR